MDRSIIIGIDYLLASPRMTTEEKDLISKRGSFKGRLTSFVNFLDSLDEKSFVSSDGAELQLRIRKMEALYDQYDEVQLRLECISDNVDTQYIERSIFEARYYKAMAQAQALMFKINKTNSDLMCSEKEPRLGNRNLVKLPTIQLPKFSGSYENWLEFHDTFSSLIHSNGDIDEINKFHYLRACLEGSAAVVIQSVEFSASNYTVAWNLLCERFDNKRLLIQNHVSALFNIDAITKESSVTLKRLIDQLNKNLRALESLGEPVKHWDTLLIHIVTHKLDSKTYRKWEEFKGRQEKNNKITFDSFIQFVRNRADLIETLEMSHSTHTTTTKSSPKVKSMVSVQHTHTSNADTHKSICPKCSGNHNLGSCSQFLALSNEARLQFLPSYKICYNCFKAGHYANQCKKPGCKICKRRHNSLIHVTRPEAAPATERTETNSNPIFEGKYTVTSSSASPTGTCASDVNSVALSASVTFQQQDVLLSTALILLHDNNNVEHIARAVLDSGSTSSFMTERLRERLNLNDTETDRSIMGINNVTSHVGKRCHVHLKSLDKSYVTDLCCFVLPSITSSVPGRELDLSTLQLPSHICLADPTFYKPAEVDLLIGADLFWDLLGSQRINLGSDKPVLFETRLGWIVSGPISCSYANHTSLKMKCNFAQSEPYYHGEMDDIRKDLTRFWQLEEISSKSSTYSPEEKMCEDHFEKNMSRLPDGHFCVRLPFKQEPELLGDSLKRSTQCLFSLERRLLRNPELSRMYHEFLSEYKSLGHMSACETIQPLESAYFMPHHSVLRESSTTTKLRVVFNASSPTTSGLSLNDLQMVGPVVQDDLLSILLRFRQHKYILSADVEKMYRCIMVHPDDRSLQQIVWRDNQTDPLQAFKLNTVTYGTASAPFLATRCLKQLGLDCQDKMIGDIILHDFYVDDLLTGGNHLDEVKVIRKDVTAVLASAGMPLRKWKSNEPELLSDVAETSLDLNIGSREPSKLLGLGWHSDSDELCFPLNSIIPNGNTKRDLLSVIAQVFDPLGLLAPCVIVLKMLMQGLWLDKLTWDEPLTPDITKRWYELTSAMPLLSNIRIPRMVVCDSYKTIELHVFTDASERAYGACIYVRSINDQGDIMVRLLIAKSRVAPLKPTTIPRLELCGALVGARLYEKVVDSLRAKIDQIYFWSDSTIVLGWLRMLPCRLQPFVRNRIAEILEKTGHHTWRHVSTDKNPADLVSRGVDISVLQDLALWWSGPGFLKEDRSNWPSQPNHSEELPETRIQPNVSLNVITNDNCNTHIIDLKRFSNYLRLVRCMAYVIRFIKRCKKHVTPSSFLTDEELRNALNIIISKCQDESFPEYKILIEKQKLPKKSPLLKFNVFLDENNVMRVGGRLDNSDFPYNKKHPIILQSNHSFTKLLFDHEHKKLMHAAPQLLLASIRESYWPIRGRNLAKACYYKCVLCRRMVGKVMSPLMGNLPRERVLAGHPFESVGVDYAGPIMSASRQGRGCRLLKVYICIFVCFTTKAIHLELVGDLTSNTYLSALRRFMSRRGKPANIYSDNGTSFVGACNELSSFLKANCDSISENMANENIAFHFIPAYSPHFGGLWEAGVKSTKYHLYRVLGNCNLTFEELYTTLTQIEAILNSRPLTPLSSDPADLTPLTPGHLLIGRSLTSLPQPDYRDTSTPLVTRFKRVEQLRQHFWERWSKEYVAELQQRVKWCSSVENLQPNTMVVVKETHLPPLKWRLGRVVATYPGADGIVRVADIQTSTGVIRRAFSKICPLPIAS